MSPFFFPWGYHVQRQHVWRDVAGNMTHGTHVQQQRLTIVHVEHRYKYLRAWEELGSKALQMMEEISSAIFTVGCMQLVCKKKERVNKKRRIRSLLTRKCSASRQNNLLFELFYLYISDERNILSLSWLLSYQFTAYSIGLPVVPVYHATCKQNLYSNQSLMLLSNW